MTQAISAVLALILAIMASAPTLASAATPSSTDAPPPEDACDYASPHSMVFACYADLAAKTRAEVDRVFSQDLKTAIALDRDFNVHARRDLAPRSRLADDLKASQAAWLRYAKTECAFEGGTSFGGSGTDILDASCHCRLNRQRLAELKKVREWVDN